MKFTTAIASALCLLPVAFANTYKITYDQFYDNKDASLNSTACSNGPNGLITKGYTTLGSLPDFPYIGGSFAVPHWDSPGCGTCWQLNYNGTTIDVLAVDTAGVGFNLALEAFEVLGGETGVEAGFVYATATQVDSSVCGL
ncbi:immunomodulatory protein [Wolfiporia cocos MD-104 SS10]|uniref:Immunomodulatory protein n=1 Tax=Wolfiporia cocos (strain MD-104) TaxID=742152 RepID=A0A2H3JTM0_WOLCO|nr:immunomodulatory protein [Wolfiporia cocos MD-104 SS10]